jgi:hypothetical protein
MASSLTIYAAVGDKKILRAVSNTAMFVSLSIVIIHNFVHEINEKSKLKLDINVSQSHEPISIEDHPSQRSCFLTRGNASDWL